MRILFLYTIIALNISSGFSIVAAQEKTTVKASADRSSILIGEPILFKLEADIPENEAIRFFRIDSIPHFEFLNRKKIDTVNTGTGTILIQENYITSFDSGHWVIPSLPLGEDLATDSIPIDVVFSPFNPDQPYHDIKEIIEVNPADKKKEIPWWYFVAGGLILVMLLWVLFRKKKQPAPLIVAPPPDPYEVAMKKLDQLRKEDLEPKTYYSRLVDIFREFVQMNKGIHSMQNTTGDLVEQLANLPFDKKLFDQLAQDLALSDFVKFAKYTPSAGEKERIFETIKNSIMSIRQIPDEKMAGT